METRKYQPVNVVEWTSSEAIYVVHSQTNISVTIGLCSYYIGSITIMCQNVEFVLLPISKTATNFVLVLQNIFPWLDVRINGAAVLRVRNYRKIYGAL